jgi:hypothetical protein
LGGEICPVVRVIEREMHVKLKQAAAAAAVGEYADKASFKILRAVLALAVFHIAE